MIPIIITGHGQFATSMRETISYIFGNLSNIYFIDFNNGMKNYELEMELKNILATLNSPQVIFLTDLAGGTPFSTAVLISKNKLGYKVFSGCNLPMIIASIELSLKDNIDSITSEILNFSKSGIILFENNSNSIQITENIKMVL